MTTTTTPVAAAGVPRVPQRTAREQARFEATRREILAAARAELAAGRDVSVRQVAPEIGLTASAIYRYFPSVAELLAALVDELYAEFREELDGSRSRPVDPLALVVAVRDWSANHPAELRLLLTGPAAPMLATLCDELRRAHGALYGDDNGRDDDDHEQRERIDALASGDYL